MQHSHIKQYNDLMLEYMKEKDIASLSGRLLRKRQDKKLAYQSRMKELEEQDQIKLLV
ncbi:MULTISPECIES: hypothetical protein [Orbaceae]|uniref:Bacteriophage P22 Orf201 C-terminal domain-containing protein n=1 Tax=Gilliamella apis TaxID=1970738 RepID=A0A2V4DUE1_9GAMM|nr:MULTISPECIES: hypothetical protein [Orbaceae]PXY91761.1 hypothetical protein DKK78_05435 [Gilliamella apis]WLS93235.1 hypothetical protein RAM17_08235 [Gilliamella apis]